MSKTLINLGLALSLVMALAAGAKAQNVQTVFIDGKICTVISYNGGAQTYVNCTP